jgi:hypothetical protein
MIADTPGFLLVKTMGKAVIPFLLCFDLHPFRLLERTSLPWIPAFAGMTFSATSLVKAVIPANAGIQGR